MGKFAKRTWWEVPEGPIPSDNQKIGAGTVEVQDYFGSR